MSEFSDTEFIAGSLTGVRSFSVDQLGRLVSPSMQDEVWTPGENTARCRKDEFTSYGGIFTNYLSQLYAPLTGPPFTFTLEKTNAPTPVGLQKVTPELDKAIAKTSHHRAGIKGCKCGYYAYFDEDHNPHHGKSNVLCVIEGYGLLTVGTRGFRAEKARLLALVVKPRHRSLRYQHLQRNYPSLPVFPSRTAALAEFPLTPPTPLSPETDEQFWTRKVSL
jgi:hypothetical protein